MKQKPHALIYARNVVCSRLHKLYSRDFIILAARTESEFLRLARDKEVDVAILCFCFADTGRIGELVRLKERISHLPIVISCRFPDPDFIRLAAQKNLDHFVSCQMPGNRIRRKIQDAIEANGMRAFLESQVCAEAPTTEAYTIIGEIQHILPRRPELSSIAQALDLSVRRVQTLFQDQFGCTFSRLTRRILIFRALNLMKHSRLDQTEIALELGYSEHSSLSRIFRKELGYPPSAARNYLDRYDPAHLLKRSSS